MGKWTFQLTGAGLFAASLLLVPGTAGAAVGCYVGCTPPVVSGTATTPAIAPTAQPVGPSVAAASSGVTPNGSSSLPFTGGDIVELSVIGAGALALGGVLARRRRDTPQTDVP